MIQKASCETKPLNWIRPHLQVPMSLLPRSLHDFYLISADMDMGSCSLAQALHIVDADP
jgi:hypothetical protein